MYPHFSVFSPITKGSRVLPVICEQDDDGDDMFYDVPHEGTTSYTPLLGMLSQVSCNPPGHDSAVLPTTPPWAVYRRAPATVPVKNC